VARPEIKGLKYFPFDVGFFRDRKIKLIRGEQGSDGVEVYLSCRKTPSFSYGDIRHTLFPRI